MTPMSRLMIAAYERHQIIIKPNDNWSKVRQFLKETLPECLEITRKTPIPEIRCAVVANLYYNRKLPNAALVKIFEKDNSSIVHYKKMHKKWLNFDKQYTEIYNLVKQGEYNQLRTKYLLIL